jgi:trans-2,3-dihydro-3-hydroxyanthranilate isomerase
LVDVFAEAPFGGNQLCVVPEVPPELDDATMQALAREIGFSETTFVTRTRPTGYDVRIFTPDAEIPFAGHPTIGTAFVLALEGRTGPAPVQHSAAGDVPVRCDLGAGRATMRQLPPRLVGTIEDRALVAAAALLDEQDLIEDLSVVVMSTGLPHILVPVRDVDVLHRARRDDRGCGEVCGAYEAESLYLFVVRGSGDVQARMFDRFPSIGEDPASGSAAGPLGAYLSIHGLAGMPGRMTVAQGEQTGRPSFLEVDVVRDGDDWVVHVGGGVRLVGEGAFRLGSDSLPAQHS